MIAIIDYDAGNIRSVEKAVKRFEEDVILTRDAEMLRKADKVILPGGGAFGDAMDKLSGFGLVDVIREITEAGKPFLGICLGLQLLFEESHEYGIHQGLGLIKGTIASISEDMNEANITGLKVPHMGWNSITNINNSVFNCNVNNEFVYFVHSYYVPLCNETVGCCDYIQPFSAVLKKDNFYATQFHIEKSGSVGEMILKGFLDL